MQSQAQNRPGNKELKCKLGAANRQASAAVKWCVLQAGSNHPALRRDLAGDVALIACDL